MAEDEDLVALDDGLKPVGYRDHCTIVEALLDQFLNGIFCHQIDVGCGFIKDHNFALFQDGSADANDRLYARAQVATFFVDVEIEQRFRIIFVQNGIQPAGF